MSKIIKIKELSIKVNTNEFNRNTNTEFCNIRIYQDLSELDRLSSFLNICQSVFNLNNIYFHNITHGGFLALFSKYKYIYINNDTCDYIENICENIKHKSNIYLNNYNYKHNSLLFNCDYTKTNDILISKTRHYDICYKLWDTDFYINLPNIYLSRFKAEFEYYIVDDILEYDNLINLCIMVKNAGEQFRNMLIENLQFIDKYTILDTGSTDNTIEIAKDVLKNKCGNIYIEDFINFRDSRNRLLELAGNSCKYNIVLDDTYIIRGDLRRYLRIFRGDTYFDSISLSIKSGDVLYQSNRILVSEKNLKYIYRIHEVIQNYNNKNITLLKSNAYIEDYRFDYMEKRTMERKQYDLEQLYLDLEDNPNDPRIYYYLAQTYNLLGDYKKAYDNFMKRVSFKYIGLLPERFDAAFEAARIVNFHSKEPWNVIKNHYKNAYNIDTTRPDPLYYIGIHYYNVLGDTNKAFKYLYKAYKLGFPEESQYSLRPTITYHFVPYFLAKICYTINKYSLGFETTKLFIENNKPNCDRWDEMLSWYNIYKHLVSYTGEKIPKISDKPIICYVADGGYTEWDGNNIYSSGVGGSETYIIEMARNMAKFDTHNVYVFCKCISENTVDGVNYIPITKYSEFVYTNYIHTSIVSRYTEYLPVSYNGYTENVYLVLHDLLPIGNVIPRHPKLKQIFCLTNWHVDFFLEKFPILKEITTSFNYGLDQTRFNINIQKKPYNFIFSSCAYRGLLPLLEMWPDILNIQPLASLDIYCDIENEWANTNYNFEMTKIKELLKLYTNHNINYHGWVSKECLANAWCKADIWLYPCTFLETFCLTALEAAYTKTLVIHNNIGALCDTVGNRGIIINGKVDEDWKARTLVELKHYLNNNPPIIKQMLIEKNYKWAENMTWENKALLFYTTYILPNQLEYKNMYNWTHDLPFGSKDIFLRSLEYFKLKNTKQNPKILEIGTYTGTSLIEIVKSIPNSTGLGIDMWTPYIESDTICLKYIDKLDIYGSFHKNIKYVGLENRITGKKMDSTDFLVESIANGNKYDIIYIDGCHKLLDTYSDLILSYQILEIGGLMIIDDYLFNSIDTNILEKPFDSINRFLSKYENNIKILDKSYRVFLEKISG